MLLMVVTRLLMALEMVAVAAAVGYHTLQAVETKFGACIISSHMKGHKTGLKEGQEYREEYSSCHIGGKLDDSQV